MFYADRKELMQSIKIMKGDVCSYGQTEIDSMCDCKYRKDETKHSPFSESFSGCAELSNVYTLLDKMTDDEYDRILNKAVTNITDRDKQITYLAICGSPTLELIRSWFSDNNKEVCKVITEVENFPNAKCIYHIEKEVFKEYVGKNK